MPLFVKEFTTTVDARRAVPRRAVRYTFPEAPHPVNHVRDTTDPTALRRLRDRYFDWLDRIDRGDPSIPDGLGYYPCHQLVEIDCRLRLIDEEAGQ